MRINTHCHVFTFDTFLTSAAEENLKARLTSWHLSNAAASDAIKLAKRIIFNGDTDERIADFAKRHGLEGSSILEFLRRGCLDTVSEVTDALMRDTVAAAGTDDVVVTPLMLDVIGDDNVTNWDKALFRNQYEQTVLQAVRYPGRVLPFMAFNPNRADSYDWTKSALESGHCVGVKLYPSLGCDMSDQGTKQQFSKVLQLCQDFDAPVTMHCNDGGFCGPDYNNIACSPIVWEPFIENAAVRFNFAHFGDLADPKMTAVNPTLWRDYILQLMDKFPERVYADVSYQAGALAPAAEKAAYFGWLNNQLAQPRGRQILFGTDSFILLQAVADTTYWQFFETGLGTDFQRVAEANPKKFLGIPQDGASVSPGSALERHIAFLKGKKAEPGSGFGQGAAPAAWLDGRL
jgi:predicted TIM-barrel fold metal-dependent hydrolase